MDDEEEEIEGENDEEEDHVFYLQYGDSKEFEKRKKGVNSQIDVFEKNIGEEEIKNFNLSNLDQIFKSLKNHAVESNNCNIIINFFQKIQKLSNHKNNSEFWLVIDEISKIIDPDDKNNCYFFFDFQCLLFKIK